MIRFLRRLGEPARRQRLLRDAKPRVVRVHRVDAQPPGAEPPAFARVAFEFLDPPGPFSMQFLEVAPEQAARALALQPDDRVEYLESLDGARARALRLPGGEVLWPR
jgi:hypothetical protein